MGFKRSSKDLCAIQPPRRRRSCKKKHRKSSVATTIKNNTIIPQEGKDVICGRGCGRHTKSKGNLDFRKLVFSRREIYEKAEKTKKNLISKKIVDHVLREKNGRFVYSDPVTYLWKELSYEKCVEKTCQTFRDFRTKKTSPTSKRKSSSRRPTAAKSDETGPLEEAPENKTDSYPKTPRSSAQAKEDPTKIHPQSKCSSLSRNKDDCPSGEEDYAALLLLLGGANKESDSKSSSNHPWSKLGGGDLKSVDNAIDALHFLHDDRGDLALLESDDEDIPCIPTPPDFVATTSFVSVWDQDCSKWNFRNDNSMENPSELDNEGPLTLLRDYEVNFLV
jgi:hypothetical protein